MLKLQRRYFFIVPICVSTLVLLIPWISSPSLNLEYIFVFGAEVIAGKYPKASIHSYFDLQANPLGTSGLVVIASKLMPWVPILTSGRLLSIVGLLMSLLAGYLAFQEVNRLLPSKKSMIWICFMLSHPLLLPYSVRLSSDMIHASLIFLAFVLVSRSTFEPKSAAFILVPVLVLWTSALKLTSIIFATMFLLFWQFQPGEDIWNSIRTLTRKLIGGIITGFIGLLIFFVWQRHTFGVLLVTSKFERMLSPQLRDPIAIVARMCRYWVFLTIFLSPLILAEIREFTTQKFRRYTSLVVSPIIFFLAIRKDPMGGELDFGGLSTQGSWFELILLGAGSVLACISWWLLTRIPKLRITTLTSIFLPIMIMSLTRPVQRYLMPLVLIGAFMLIREQTKTKSKELFQWCGILLHGILALTLLVYQHQNAVAADQMAKWIQRNNIIQETTPNAVQPHAGYYWMFLDLESSKYIVTVSQNHRDCDVHYESIEVFGVARSFYCLNLENPLAGRWK